MLATEVMIYFLEKGLDPSMQGLTFASLLQVAVLGGSMDAGACISGC
jgi:hypothetical protein